tara:strand:- start:4725 stop:5678 length:954 start_codon:yes stop_codon:yes gene_type:complete
MSNDLKQVIFPVVFHKDYTIDPPGGHRFPMGKNELIMKILLNNGLLDETRIFTPNAASRKELCLAHDSDYIDNVLKKQLDKSAERILGFQCSDEIVRRALAAVGGTILTGRLAIENRIAFNLAGGSHHGHPGHAAGFCLFNDVAVAVKVLQKESIIRKALIIDLDVHQGDGTACFFSHDPSVFTFSIHCEQNYPDKKQFSNMDFGLPEGTGDNKYISCLKTNLPVAIQKSNPDIVFFNAGVDPHLDDKLGKLQLSNSGLIIRDYITLELCWKSKIPVACVIGGGYADNLHELAYKHTSVLRATQLLVNGKQPKKDFP